MKHILLLLKATRPKQWIKNLLVAAAPIAAGDLFNEINKIFLGIIGFTATSVIGYLVNDWLDQDFDRRHNRKKLRPFASKQLRFNSFILLLILNSLISLITCFLLPSEFTQAILAYLFITLSYSFSIKHQPVIEILWLATGFLVRAVAGSAIIQKSPSGWFVIAVWFGAIFIVSAKRLAELKQRTTVQTRRVISSYNQNYLNMVLTSSVSITLLTYALWIFEIHSLSVLAQLTILPLTLSMFLYAWHCEKGDAESPETLIFTDKIIILSAAVTILLLVIVMYA